MTDTVHAAALLLERVPVIIKNYEEQYRKTGLTYNIFKIAGIGEREVIVCRVLADLLDPKGLHGRGNVYLKLFMDMVVRPLIEKTGNFDLSKAKVITEYTINEDRRIDIVLDDGTIFIPIEVKINAGEQKNQLGDYADFSRRMNVIPGFIPVLFLTPDGRNSQEASKDDYISISFGRHIISWLVKCLNLEETDRAATIREILKQLIKAIKSFCGFVEDEEMANAINALVAESKESYTAALLISRAVNGIDFDGKVWEIFKDQIFKLVKNKFPDTECIETGEEGWYHISIPTGKNRTLSINYDMKKISVNYEDSKNPVSGEIAGKIKKTLSVITGVHSDDCGEDFIWFSESCKYPGLEGIDDDEIYKYELYQIYSKDAQAVADRIISMAMELRSI